MRSPGNPNGDIAIEFSGLRPGEKLYEELLIGDDVSPTAHPMIMTANEDFLPWEVLRERLAVLLKAVADDDFSRIRHLLRELVSGYSPEGEIVDWLYQQQNKDR